MRLNEQQLELMTKVRDRMYADFETDKYLARKYICHNIVQIEHGLENFNEFGGYVGFTEKEGSLSRGLVELINAAIEGWIAFDLYLDEGLQIGLNWSLITTYFQHVGRLAWLDRIVETGEIG